MSFLIKAQLLSVLFTIFIFSQTIEKIEIAGNKSFTSDQYIQWSGVNAGSKLYKGIIDSVKTRLAANLGMLGYFHADFSRTQIEFYPDSQHVSLSINVEENSPTYIKNIYITGLDSSAYRNIKSSFDFLENHIYNKFDLEENISNALNHFQNHGYPFAKIIVESVYFLSDTNKNDFFANINLKIDKDRYCKIDSIEIDGNKKTNSNVIERELRIKPGEEYSQKQIDNLPNQLNRLAFFEPVSLPEYYINSKNEGVLKITLKEKETNNFDGIIGYIPAAAQNTSGYFTGLVDISLRNLFGSGRAASIHWQQYARSSQDLELKYLEPWLFGYPFNLNLSFQQRSQDSTYVQRDIQASLEYLATETISASVFISTDAVIPTDNGNQIFTVYNSSSVTTGFNLKIDTRDDPYSPTQGILFLNSYSFSRKNISGPVQYFTPDMATNINLQRLELDLETFYEIFTRQVIAFGIHGRELRGSFLENSDLYRLGGTNSLRGYNESQFLGNRIMWTNLEFRSLLTRRSFAFLFFDTGYYLRNSVPAMNILKSEGFNIGYGIGMDIETGLGVLSVSFALAKGDTFSNGKIHFGIVNQF